MKRFALALSLLLVTGSAAAADLQAVTTDGRKVLLHSDNTWEYLDATSAENDEAELEKLLLTLRRVDDSGTSCKIAVRLQNRSRYLVTSLVPQFTAYNKDDISLITVFEDFLAIKPTYYQDAEITFRAVKCDNISSVRVHGGDKCTMDDMTRFSYDKGDCLKRVKVIASDLLKFMK